MQDILIVGAGTAGLTAAIYAARAGKTVTVLENEAVGGQIATSPQVENYPGFESISGAEFSDRLFTQATVLGVSVELEKAQAVRAQDGMFTVETSGESYSARALILATGVKHRRLGLAEEASYLGRGLSYCAVCDGAFFKNRTVAVVGGGNAALQSAIYLADVAEKVYLIHRRTQYRAEEAVIRAMEAKPNIELVLNKTVAALSGEPLLQSLTLRDTQTGETSELPVNGVFVSIGKVPANDFCRDIVTLDDAGFIVADESCKTNVPGLFAAGDCRTKTVRQLTTAASDGSIAALAACDYLNANA